LEGGPGQPPLEQLPHVSLEEGLALLLLGVGHLLVGLDVGQQPRELLGPLGAKAASAQGHIDSTLNIY